MASDTKLPVEVSVGAVPVAIFDSERGALGAGTGLPEESV